MRRSLYLTGLAVLLLASCGKQYTAKSLVKEFVKENAADEINITSFSDLDSTKLISDSLLQVLQKRAASDPLFKPGLSFKEQRNDPTLLFIRMHFQLPNDTLEQSRTFYFDRDLTKIITFK